MKRAFVSILLILILILCAIFYIINNFKLKSNSVGEHIIKIESQQFDSVINTFAFRNFKTANSYGDCFGICLVEKCIFEGNLENYYKNDIGKLDELSNYRLNDKWFTDGNLDFNKIDDANVLKMLECIDYFQNNQNELYNRKNLKLEDVIQKINNNSPVIIIIPYDKGSHAILAYGYYISNDKKTVKIYIADPNKSKDFHSDVSNSIIFVNKLFGWDVYYKNKSILFPSMDLADLKS